MITSKPSGVKTYESLQYISGPLQGNLNDWPANIQDAIFAALERLAKREQLPLAIVHSSCEIDHGDEKTKDKYFIRIIASEIVARDMRFSNEEMMKKAYYEILQGGGRH